MESNNSNQAPVEDEKAVDELIESIDCLTLQGTEEELEKVETWANSMRSNVQIYVQKVTAQIRKIEEQRRKDPTNTTVDKDVEDCIKRAEKAVEIIDAFILIVQYDPLGRKHYKEAILRYLQFLRKPKLPLRKQ